MSGPLNDPRLVAARMAGRMRAAGFERCEGVYDPRACVLLFAWHNGGQRWYTSVDAASVEPITSKRNREYQAWWFDLLRETMPSQETP